MRSLEWTHSAKQYFERLPPRIQRQVRRRIEELLEDPLTDAVALKDWGGIRRARSGDWRILFRATADTIRVIAVGPPGDIYK